MTQEKKEEQTNLMTVTFSEETNPDSWGIEEDSVVGDIYGLELVRIKGKVFDFNLKKLYHQSK
jgi:hypothetical protein